MTFAATSLLVATPTSWVASSYEFADYVYVCDGHGVSRILSPPLLLPSPLFSLLPPSDSFSCCAYLACPLVGLLSNFV